MADTDTTTPVVASGSESPKEDAATKSAREELKHTVISEKLLQRQEDGRDQRGVTPESKTTRLEPPEYDALRDQVSSPKKKRAYDEVDDGDDDDNKNNEQDGGKKNKDEQSDGGGGAETAPASSGGSPGASGRAEPEKKRLRDKPTEEGAAGDTKAESKTSANTTSTAAAASKEDKPATSSSAFASSGFAKLSNSASPFGALGGAGAASTPSLFGSSTSAASPFGALGSASPAAKPASPSPGPALASPPKLTFGGGAASPFASLQGSSSSNNVFGSSFGSGATGASGFGGIGRGIGGGAGPGAGATRSVFGSALSGPGLTSFAKPGETFKSGKPAKPFGAPESDAEDSGDEDSGAEEDENGDEDDGAGEEGDEKESEERSEAPSKDDKKRQRLQRVAVDDGEAGEATLLQVRARMYYLDKDQGGWKERGAGTLKVNVPEHCVEYDRDGSVIPASFDASTLNDHDDDEDNEDEGQEEDKADGEGDEDKSAARPAAARGAAALPKRNVVRLIMRQDSTHRVILNTVVLAATDFTERQTLKATTILFTAFEGEDAKPLGVQIKMSVANAKTFLAMMDGIQKELRGD